MENKTLCLSLKSQWYNMIEGGVKKEEYRELKDYWHKRLNGRHYDYVKFTYGYTKRCMIFEIKNIVIGIGNTLWGAEEGVDYYVIKLGNKVK